MMKIRHRSLLGLSLLALSLLASFIFTNHAFAIGGGPGGTGDQTGCQQVGNWTCNGHGWVRITNNGPTAKDTPGPPDQFDNNTNWQNDVLSTCNKSSYTTPYIDVYLIDDQNGNGMGYNYLTEYDGDADQFPSGTGNYGNVAGDQAIDSTQAYKDFQKFESDYTGDTSNFNWGSNVAWFCDGTPVHNPPPPSWNLSGSSVVSNTKFGVGVNANDNNNNMNDNTFGPNSSQTGPVYYASQVTVTNASPNGQNASYNWQVQSCSSGTNGACGSYNDVSGQSGSATCGAGATCPVYTNGNTHYSWSGTNNPGNSNSNTYYCERIKFTNATGPSTNPDYSSPACTFYKAYNPPSQPGCIANCTVTISGTINEIPDGYTGTSDPRTPMTDAIVGLTTNCNDNDPSDYPQYAATQNVNSSGGYSFSGIPAPSAGQIAAGAARVCVSVVWQNDLGPSAQAYARPFDSSGYRADCQAGDKPSPTNGFGATWNSPNPNYCTYDNGSGDPNHTYYNFQYGTRNAQSQVTGVSFSGLDFVYPYNSISGCVMNVGSSGARNAVPNTNLVINDTNGQSLTETTDSNGCYSANVEAGAGFNITPSNNNLAYGGTLYTRPFGSNSNDSYNGCGPFGTSYSNSGDYCFSTSYQAQGAGYYAGNGYDRADDSGYDFMYSTTTVAGCIYSIDSGGNRGALGGIGLSVSDTDGYNPSLSTGSDGCYSFNEMVGAGFSITPDNNTLQYGGVLYTRPWAVGSNDSYANCGPFGASYSNTGDYCGTTSYQAQGAGYFANNGYDRADDSGYDFTYPLDNNIEGDALAEDYNGTLVNLSGVTATMTDAWTNVDGTPGGKTQTYVTSDGSSYNSSQPAGPSNVPKGWFYFTAPVNSIFSIGLPNPGADGAPTTVLGYAGTPIGPDVRPFGEGYGSCPAYSGAKAAPPVDWCEGVHDYTNQYPVVNSGSLDRSSDVGYDFVYYPPVTCGSHVTTPKIIQPKDSYTLTEAYDYPPNWHDQSGAGIGGTMTLSGDVPPFPSDSEGIVSPGQATFGPDSTTAAHDYVFKYASTLSTDQSISCTDEMKVVDIPTVSAQGSGGVDVGGDFSSKGGIGGGVLASWNNNNNGISDYGASSFLVALATGQITGFASNQSAFQNSSGGLTFANVSSGGGSTVGVDAYSPLLGGKYNSTNTNNLTDMSSLPNANSSTSPPITLTSLPGVTNNIDISSLDSAASGFSRNDYVYNSSSQANAVVNGSTIKPGDNLAMFVNGNVYITSNITYCGDSGGCGGSSPTWSKSNDVPSFVLRATGNIYIAPGVTELDGTYIGAGKDVSTTGEIDTCSQASGTSFSAVPASSKYTTCNNQLAVYGSFITDKLKLQRTYGTLRDGIPNGSVSSVSASIGSPTCTPLADVPFGPYPCETTGTSYYDDRNYELNYPFTNIAGNYKMTINYSNSGGPWPPPSSGSYKYHIIIYVNGSPVQSADLSPQASTWTSATPISIPANAIVSVAWTNNDSIDSNGNDLGGDGLPGSAYDPNFQIDGISASTLPTSITKNGANYTTCTPYDPGNSYIGGACFGGNTGTSVDNYGDYRATYNFGNAAGSSYNLVVDYENYPGTWPPPGSYAYNVNIYVGGVLKVANYQLPKNPEAVSIPIGAVGANQDVTIEWTNNEWIDKYGNPEPNPATATDTTYDPNLQIDTIGLISDTLPSTPNAETSCTNAGAAAPITRVTIGATTYGSCSAEVFYNDNEAALADPAVCDPSSSCSNLEDDAYGSAPPVF